MWRSTRLVIMLILLIALTGLNGGQVSCRQYSAEKEVEGGSLADTKQEEASKSEEGDDRLLMNEDDEYGDTSEEELESEDDDRYVISNPSIFIEPTSRLGTKPLRLTLEDCVRIALVNNNKVQATEYGIDAAKAQLSEASARFWPIFEYEWLTAPVPDDVQHAPGSFFRGDLAWWNKLRIGMGMPVYAFGKLSIAQDLARGGIAAARAERSKEKLTTVTHVRQLYYGVLLAEELGRLLINAHHKLSNSIEKKKKDGERSPIDKIKGRVFLVDLEKRLAEARDKEMLALEGLRIQMGLNPDVAVMVYSKELRPVSTRLQPVEEYLETALVNRPDVKLIEVGVEARRNQYRLEQRKFLPDVGVGAYFDIGRTHRTVRGVTATDDFSNPFNFTRAGIGMRVEGKFDVHGQHSRMKKAKSNYYKASLEHYMAKDGITLEVKKAYMDTVTSLDNVRRAEKTQQYARQLMFLTQSNYELGIGDENEYIDALQLVLLTRGKYFEAVFNYNVALAILDEKAGIVPEVGTYLKGPNE